MSGYCGLDISNKSTAMCVVDGKGAVVEAKESATTEKGLTALLSGKQGLTCVVEAGPLSEWVCQIVEKLGHKIEMIDPRRAKAVTETRRKTDKIDAEMLAQLSRTGWYTKVHRKSEQSRELRSYLVGRRQLVKIKGQLCSTIRGLLRANGIVLEAGDGKKFERNVTKALENVLPLVRELIVELLRTWKEVSERETRLYAKLNRKIAKEHAGIRNLMSVPGVGPATAALFVSTIDDPKRFKSSEQVAPYLGLVPSVYKSGEVEIRGRITKQGDDLLRWHLIEAATVILCRSKAELPLKQWGLRLQEKKGFGKARVALARKLAGILHHMWLNAEAFDPQACKPA